MLWENLLSTVYPSYSVPRYKYNADLWLPKRWLPEGKIVATAQNKKMYFNLVTHCPMLQSLLTNSRS